MVLGLLGLLTITAIPTVTGVAEGVSHQQEQNKEVANESRLEKFHLDVFCDAKSSKRGHVDGTIIVLRDDKVRFEHLVLHDQTQADAYCFNRSTYTLKIRRRWNQLRAKMGHRHHIPLPASTSCILTTSANRRADWSAPSRWTRRC